MNNKYAYKLDLLSVIAISLSSMLGSGIFVLPGLAYMLTGPSLWLAYLIAGLAIVPSALSKSELASAMPSNGGTYVYLERTFGPSIGTLTGIGLWLSLLLKSSFALIGLGAYLSIFFNFEIRFVAVTILALILILNIYGISKISKLIKIIIVMTISSILIVTFKTLNTSLTIHSSTPFLTNGMDGLLNAVAFVFISYAGVTKVAAIAGEIKDPSKNLPKGILYSLIIATTLYTMLSYCLPLVIPHQELSGNLKSFYDMGNYLFSKPVAVVFGTIAIVTMASMANAGILAASRFPFAMSIDRLLPSIFSKLSSKYHTPYISLILTSITATIFIIFFPIEKTAKLASGFLLFIYALEHVSLIILRELRIQWYEPKYKTPLYPIPQILGILTCLYLLYEMGIFMLYGIICVSIPGLLIFFFYNKNKVERKGVIGIRGPREDLISEQTPVKHTKTNNDGFYSDVNVIILGGEISPEYLCEFALIFSQVNEIKVSYISEIPEGNQFYNLDNDPIQQSVKRRLKAMSESIGKEIHFNSITTYDLVGTLYHLSNIKQTNWIITEGSSHKQGLLTFHNPFGWIKKRLSSNLAIYKNKGIRYIKNILIYYRKNDHFDFLLTTSLHLSQYYKAGVTLLTYEDQEQTKETLSNLNKLHNLENIKISQYQKNKTQLNQLIHLTSEYDLLIFESCALDFWHTIFSEENHILKYATCSVLAIRANTTTPIT